MRAISLTAISLSTMAAVLIFGFGLPCRAQAPDTSSNPQALTGAGGKDSRDAKAAPEKAKTSETKASETKTSETKTGEGKKSESITKSDAKGRVNTLSPEEQRRAARAHERAATKVTKSTGDSHGPKVAGPKVAAVPSATPTQDASSARPRSVAAIKRPRKTSVAEARGRRSPGSRNPELATRGWVPRVGGVVPRGVPLYPVPPGYRPGPGYAGGPVYVVRQPGPYIPGAGYPSFPHVGQAYPAFPRVRGDVDIDDDN